MHPQGLARRRQGRLTSASIEQTGAQLGFKLAHLLAQGGLRQIQLGRGPGEAPLAGGFEEVFQLIEVHRFFRRYSLETNVFQAP